MNAAGLNEKDVNCRAIWQSSKLRTKYRRNEELRAFLACKCMLHQTQEAYLSFAMGNLAIPCVRAWDLGMLSRESDFWSLQLILGIQDGTRFSMTGLHRISDRSDPAAGN